ncbi:hypothetical protein ALON55S_01607 [Alishewanella longhuensis]
MRFNRQQGLEPVTISSQTAAVIAEADPYWPAE